MSNRSFFVKSGTLKSESGRAAEKTGKGEIVMNDIKISVIISVYNGGTAKMH